MKKIEKYFDNLLGEHQQGRSIDFELLEQTSLCEMSEVEMDNYKIVWGYQFSICQRFWQNSPMQYRLTQVETGVDSIFSEQGNILQENGKPVPMKVRLLLAYFMKL